MRLFEPIEQLEENEDSLRKQVNALPEAQKKEFYKRQSEELKDPDTYAALNWFFLGGFHHCYLRKYALFSFELILLTISIIGLVLEYTNSLFIIAFLVLFELPQLFFSQKIARQYNYDVSCDIFNEVSRG
ncbi:TM2 domain-containing protein [Shewanella psychrotolerans]|uniref:TM2 domain-containing protein n=1 Tax=Shewanella psychrotolerans TaxID=2864206 RepID=UPI001C659A99|nr:TM2 domain-containing protein [Shewanella psychrotolerans]QYK00845.1 TM2 domain-containing protein [Shewanella psychrotolerans]